MTKVALSKSTNTNRTIWHASLVLEWTKIFYGIYSKVFVGQITFYRVTIWFALEVLCYCHTFTTY